MSHDTAHSTSTVERDAVAPVEHLLAVVEPIGDGDEALEIARDVVAHGGRASVVMVITDRVADEIRDYAALIDLPDYAEADARAIERLTAICRRRIGAEVPVTVVRPGWFGVDIRRHVPDDITSVAMPEAIVGRRGVDRMVNRLGRPVIVTSRRTT